MTPELRRTDPVRVGLLGKGIAASRTPRMHVEEGAAQGLDYTYRLIDMQDAPDEPLAAILDRLEAEGFTGLNVTYPYKTEIIAHLTGLSEAASKVGAVNTVVFGGNKRRGHNTDYWGFGESLRRGLPDAPLDVVLLLGAGGAGRAVANALIDAGVDRLLIRDVDAGAARALAEGLNARLARPRALVVNDLSEAVLEAQGLVNASPIGMEKHPGIPLPETLIEPRHWIADIVYFPLETRFLALGRRLGCRVLPGSGMALFQAVRAFELFTGIRPDDGRMKATFETFG